MDCSLPGSSVHGIFQTRILEWIAIPFSRGIFLTQELNLGLLHCRQILYHLNHEGSLKIWQVNIKIFSPHMFNVSYIAKFLRGVKYETELRKLFVQKLCFEGVCDEK